MKSQRRLEATTTPTTVKKLTYIESEFSTRKVVTRMVTAWFCLSHSSSTAVKAFTVNPQRATTTVVSALAARSKHTTAAFASTHYHSPFNSNRHSQLFASRHASTTSATAPLPPSSQQTTAYDVLNQQQGLDKYEPASFESEIYAWWEASGCFQPDAKKKSGIQGKPYVLPMPPPNVTGRLHMGHAIFVTLQDVLARFHRMRGKPVLWLPGTDHAGIATQLQVEKQLVAEGTTRDELGREEFLKRVWAYKEEQGGFITSQLRSLGASADWSRERFTMDPDLSLAVVEAFNRLHDKGLVYRGEYMVNWSPMLQTAVSDLEVDYSEEEGSLYYFKYMVENSDGTYRTYHILFVTAVASRFETFILINTCSFHHIIRVHSGCHHSTRNNYGRYCRMCASRGRPLQASSRKECYCANVKRASHTHHFRRIR
jgi:hypothetical protein